MNTLKPSHSRLILIKFVWLGAIFLSLSVCPFVIKSLAQVTNENNTGFPENGIFWGGPVDAVQVANGNLHIQFFANSVKGRAGLDTAYMFIYDNKQWFLDVSCSDTGYCTGSPNGFPLLVLKGPFEYASGGSMVSYVCHPYPGANFTYVQFEGTTLIEPDSTQHHMVPDPYIPNDPSYIVPGCTDSIPKVDTLYADDGSGWTMSVTAPGRGMVRKDGIAVKGGTITDRNGNQLVCDGCSQFPSGVIDTLGRRFSGDGSYHDSGGVLRGATVTYTNVTVATKLCPTSPINLNVCTEYNGSLSEPSKITLPNGLTYVFEYNSYDSVNGSGGEPSAMILPAGGKISWSYGSWDRAGRPVTSRTVSDGNTSGTWNYSGANAYNSSVVDPAGNKTSYTCQNYQTTLAGFPPCLPIKEQEQDSSGTILHTVDTSYTKYTFMQGMNMYLPTTVTTTWNQQNQVKKVETDWDIVNMPNGRGGTGPVSWKNPVERREFDWGTGFPGSFTQANGL